METKQTKETKQFVTNVSEEQKAQLAVLKSQYNLSDKGVIALLLEVATNNQVGLMPDDEGNAQEVDTFELVVKGLNLAKKPKQEKKEKVLLTDEQKEARRLVKKLQKIQAQRIAASMDTTEEDEVETLVEVGV